MNPQEREEFNKMKKQLEELQLVRDIIFRESLRKNALQNTIEAGLKSTATSNENATTTVPSTGGNVNHARQYDDRVLVEIDGTQYYIGLYTI